MKQPQAEVAEVFYCKTCDTAMQMPHDDCLACERGERQQPQAEAVPDCGEAGHDEGCCGNRDCLPSARKKAPQQSEVGNSGFDHRTAADFLSGKTVSDEAVRKFVQASRWAHDDRASLQSLLLSVRNELASREAEIALLKKELMEAEAAPQQAEAVPAFDWGAALLIVRDCCESEKSDPDHPDTICISVQDLTAIVQQYAAPQQAEAVPFNHATQLQIAYVKGLGDGAMQAEAVPLDVMRDAERYRWLRYNNGYSIYERLFEDCQMCNFRDAQLDAAIDRAIAAQGEKP